MPVPEAPYIPAPRHTCSWRRDEGKYLENGDLRGVSVGVGSLSEAGINLKEFTGGVCGR